MAEQYTPTTEEIRYWFERGVIETSLEMMPDAVGPAFDRWLAARDAQVRSEALRQAATGARNTRFQISHGEHITYADTFEAGVSSVLRMLFAAADYADAVLDQQDYRS